MELKAGNHVKFVDEKRRTRDALVTHVHVNNTVEEHVKLYGTYPCINVVLVVEQEDRKDPYGQQTEHKSSVVYKNPSAEVAGGYFYYFP